MRRQQQEQRAPVREEWIRVEVAGGHYSAGGTLDEFIDEFHNALAEQRLMVVPGYSPGTGPRGRLILSPYAVQAIQTLSL